MSASPAFGGAGVVAWVASYGDDVYFDSIGAFRRTRVIVNGYGAPMQADAWMNASSHVPSMEEVMLSEPQLFNQWRRTWTRLIEASALP